MAEKMTTPTKTTTTSFMCPTRTPCCPMTPLTYMICEQLNVKRVTTKHKWLCFSCTTDDESYCRKGQNTFILLNDVTHIQFMRICVGQDFSDWADGSYKWYVAGGGEWGEFGIVKISKGKIVLMKQHEEV